VEVRTLKVFRAMLSALESVNFLAEWAGSNPTWPFLSLKA
jgi:hypothetical protein